MLLKNKQTGEIGWLYCDHISKQKKITVFSEERNLSAKHWDYASLAELNEEWEDAAEEPKGHWYLNYMGDVLHTEFESINPEKKIGNYFKTKEEAEKAVEKLKAWKRLKDKKIFIWLDHFDYRSQDGSFNVEFGDNLSSDELNQVNDDLDLLFFREDD